jgi:signal transduction histidine kinase/DNA-binding LacI/PurR family transcriptional regulator/AraC-like DNA-binding protein
MAQRTQHLPQHAHPTIGLLVNEVVGGAQSGFFWSGVVDVATAQSVNVLCFAGRRLRDPDDFSAQANIIYELVDKESLDGLIIWASALGTYVGPERIRNFGARFHPLPIVSVGMVLEGIPSLVLDSYQGMRDAIVHLIEVHGRRRLAFIRGPEAHREAAERYRAYIDVLKEYGLPFSPDLISPPCAWVEQRGMEAIHLLLDQRKVHFDAVVVVSDNLAVGALRALQARGIHVPGDVAMVSFNNQPVSKTVTPPLTTVPLRMYERGRMATEMLLTMMEGKPVPQQVSLPARLLVRQSCGCPDPAVMQAATGISRENWAPSASTSRSRTKAFPCELLATRREQILSEMEQAVEAAEGAPEWAEQLLDAFLSELKGEAQGVFLPAMENVLRRATETGGDVIAWEGAISALRRHALPYFRDDNRALMNAEDLWHQARVMVGERARRAQAYQEWQTSRQFDKLREIGQAMTTALEVPQLMNLLAQELPQLGFPRCYLSLYEDPRKPTEWSRLVLAYDEAGRVELGSGGRRFPSRQLVPDGLLSSEKQYHLIVEPLYFQEEQLGFLLLEGRSLRENIHGLLRDRINSALKGVLLLRQNVELYHQALEAQKVAQERERLAEEANLLKSRFLSMVSHELLTPLVLLAGLSEMMLREGTQDSPTLPESYRQDLQRIHASAQQLDSLVRDVLDLAHGQMWQLQLVKKPLDLGEILKAVALIGEQMAHAKGLSWRAEIPKLPKVLGDSTRLQQVIMNLVTNAVKFTAHGQVTLKAQTDGERVTVSVSDTGLGVPVAEQQVIFDEFRQSERTATRGYGGLGIGLAICRQLVELHGGQIGVASSGEEDGGSTFYFALPAMSVQAAEESARETRSRAVLLLTMCASGAMHLQEHLTREGFEVNAMSIDETPDWLSMVLASPPGAVVLDFQPASERGWELIETLKGNPATQDVPVLFYSLFQEQGSGSMLALDYSTKPMRTEALAQALRRHGLGNGECPENRTILVVDDDPAILEMHARIVQTHLPDCRVLRASNGRIALELMQQGPPALVLLDLMMPELDGMGVLKAMQENERTRGIPVVVLTAQRLTQEDMAQLNRGVAAVLEKGIFNTQETLMHIEQALARNKRLGSETQRTVRKVMAYIHEHYAEPISREKMAYDAGVSVRHLTRCFCQEVGISPTTYLNRYRIKQAKRLLDGGDKNITEVAEAVGFSSGSYFGQVFRREVGTSPRDYRAGLSVS